MGWQFMLGDGKPPLPNPKVFQKLNGKEQWDQYNQ